LSGRARVRKSSTALCGNRGFFAIGYERRFLVVPPLAFPLAMQRYWNHHVRRQPMTRHFHHFRQTLRTP
jgi:hypothetical protein